LDARRGVTGEWRKLHNKELRKTNTSRTMRLVGNVASIGEMRNACNILVGIVER
jgi:hypothetical protein